tara:strand:+ start:461 stop:898 length:438 start_codon:yes stop_codon:yes gene_type:complete
MRLVVDANILFNFFNHRSKTIEFLLLEYLELFAPEFALKEINKMSDLLKKKCKISNKEFNIMIGDIPLEIYFTPKDQYSMVWDKAEKICGDPDDIDYLALALKLNVPLWSNDKKLAEQQQVEVLSTLDIIQHPKFKKLFVEEKVL